MEDSRLDLQVNIKLKVTIYPSDRITIPTGILFQIPKVFEAQIRPRNGLAKNHGITVVNSPGSIDADFRGEIKVILINHSANEFVINDSDQITQIVFSNVSRIKWNTDLIKDMEALT